MSGTTLLNQSLLSAIQRLKDATAKLPQSTPEGSADGAIWENFNVNPQDVDGPIFEKINQAFTQCFPRNSQSGDLPLENVLRGNFGMDIVITFFEQCAYFAKMTSSDLHMTELKVGQLIDLVHMR